MVRRSFFFVLCATLALTAAASATPEAPTAQSIHLSGTYTCTAPQAQPMRTTWTSLMNGTWLSGDGGSVTNMVSHDAGAHLWRVASLDKTGEAMVFEGPDSSATHVVFKEVYPTHERTTTYDYVSASKYTLTFAGTSDGHAYRVTKTCIKR